MNPLISIGIPNYNYGRYLPRCIDSMLNQTYAPIEVIVADDFSTDGSIEILKAYHEKEQIQALLYNDNSGTIVRGINAVISRARGRFVYLIDSDDYLDPTCIAESYKKTVEDPQLDYVGSGCRVVDSNEKLMKIWQIGPLITNAQVVHKTFTTGGSAPFSTKGLYRASFIKKHGYISYNDSSVDTLSLMTYMHHGMKAGFLKEPLRYYRVHSNNASHNIQLRIRSADAIMNFIIEHFEPEIYLPGVCKKDVSRMNAEYFYAVANQYMRNDLPKYISHTTTKEQMVEWVEPLLKSAERQFEFTKGVPLYA